MYLVNPPIVTGDGMELAQSLQARLTEVLVENERLKSQSGRRDVVHVQVPQYVDRPELVSQIDVLKKQIEALEKARLSAVASVRQQGPEKIITKVVEKIVEKEPEIRVLEKIVTKTSAVSIYVTVATGLVGAIIGALVGKYFIK